MNDECKGNKGNGQTHSRFRLSHDETRSARCAFFQTESPYAKDDETTPKMPCSSFSFSKDKSKTIVRKSTSFPFIQPITTGKKTTTEIDRKNKMAKNKNRSKKGAKAKGDKATAATPTSTNPQREATSPTKPSPSTKIDESIIPKQQLQWNTIRTIEGTATLCRTEGCNRHAVCVLVSDLEPKDEWPVCAECREDKIEAGTGQDKAEKSTEIDENTTENTKEGTEGSKSDETEESGVKETNKEKNDVYGMEIEDPLNLKSDATLTKESDKSKEGKQEESTKPAVVEAPTDSSKSEPQGESGLHDGETSNDNQETSDEISTTSDGDTEEPWDLVKIFSVGEITGSSPKTCEHCDSNLKSAVLYQAQKSGEEWHACLDCQVSLLI